VNTLVREHLELILDCEKGIWLATVTVGGRSKTMMSVDEWANLNQDPLTSCCGHDRRQGPDRSCPTCQLPSVPAKSADWVPVCRSCYTDLRFHDLDCWFRCFMECRFGTPGQA